MFNLIPATRRAANGICGDGGTLFPFSGLFGDLNRWRDDLDRAFEQFTGELPSVVKGTAFNWFWNLDARDEGDKIVVRADAPGFEAANFELHVKENVLTIRAARKEKETEGEQPSLRSWSQKEYYRMIPLPSGLDAEKVEAHYKNGVLIVTLPKSEESKGRRIAVKS